MQEQKFWMVWNPATSHTHRKHFNRFEAEKEAERLGMENLGQKFYVFEAVTLVCPVPKVDVIELN